MQRLLIIGCGDIALRTLPLLKGRYRLYALLRNSAQRERLRALGVTPIMGDLDNRQSLHRIAGLADVVLHFAPPRVAPPLIRGGREGLVYEHCTQHLLAALSLATPPQQLLYLSTSGVYGDCEGQLVSETRPLNPQTRRAQLRVNAETQIRTWAERNHVRAHILRVPGIYAAERLPLQRIRAGAPAIEAAQDSYTNHIHADDLARIVVAALRNAKPNRVYHAADDEQMKMGDYFDAVADAYELPRPPRLPRDEVQRAVSPAMWSFMDESRRLTNERIKRELNIKLRHATLRGTVGWR